MDDFYRKFSRMSFEEREARRQQRANTNREWSEGNREGLHDYVFIQMASQRVKRVEIE